MIYKWSTDSLIGINLLSQLIKSFIGYMIILMID
jgi:hypothetical protein